MLSQYDCLKNLEYRVHNFDLKCGHEVQQQNNIHFNSLYPGQSGWSSTGGKIHSMTVCLCGYYWVTVDKMVRCMLSDCCLVCPVLSVTLVYCGQTVGRIKMKLDVQVGFSHGHIVLDGDSGPLPQKGHSPPVFGPYLLWPNGSMDQDATW